jgi:hypothetical protein
VHEAGGGGDAEDHEKITQALLHFASTVGDAVPLAFLQKNKNVDVSA